MTNDRWQRWSVSPVPLLLGAAGFLAPHLYFLLVHGKRTWFNPPTSLWPTIAALFALAVAAGASRLGQTRWVMLSMLVGVAVGDVVFWLFRRELGNLWPVELVLSIVVSTPSVLIGAYLGAGVARLFTAHRV